MFSLDRGLRYWLYSEPTDMRKSFHTLSGVVRNKIGGDPMNGDVYVFVNKRQKESYPVILQFEKWMYETARKTTQQSRIGKAIKYMLPLMPRLGRYVNDGRFCIDNNLVENAVRTLALGRKNFLLCGNHDAAVRAAIVYSLISSCKALVVDPRE